MHMHSIASLCLRFVMFSVIVGKYFISPPGTQNDGLCFFEKGTLEIEWFV